MKMSNLLNKVLIFSVGAAIGSVVTWKVTKDKYEKLNQEDSEAVRSYYKEKYKLDGVTQKGDTESKEKPVEEENTEEYYPDAPDEYYEIKDSEYNRYKHIVEDYEYEEDEDGMAKDIVVIGPSESRNGYGETGLPTLTLYYYADGIVTNDIGKIISNVDELIGRESLDRFGYIEDEPDTVYVRNNKLGIDYEILRDDAEFLES